MNTYFSAKCKYRIGLVFLTARSSGQGQCPACVLPSHVWAVEGLVWPQAGASGAHILQPTSRVPHKRGVCSPEARSQELLSLATEGSASKSAC